MYEQAEAKRALTRVDEAKEYELISRFHNLWIW